MMRSVNSSMAAVAHLASSEGDVLVAATRCPFPTITPERMLVLEIVHQACNDYLQPGVEHRRDQLDAEQWIFSASTGAWSYIDDCELLGLDYQLIRKRLLQLNAEALKLQKFRQTKHVRN